MKIWILALITLLAGTGLILILRDIRKQGAGGGKKLGAVLLGILTAGAGVLLVLGLLLADSRRQEPPDPEPAQPAQTAETLPPPPVTQPRYAQTPDPRLPPDVLKAAELTYEEQPRFRDPMELSRYLLNRFLNGQFKVDFYLSRDLAPMEGVATSFIDDCIQAAQAYYAFGAYKTYSLYIEEVGQPDWVLAHVDLRYENPDYDRQAREAAVRYVAEHPVPEGGFETAAREREYCRDIHDFIIGRISYDPIGYDPMEMLNYSQYDNKQEAYNVLVSEDTSAVCAGYARAFALIAQYAGIDCVYVTGNEKEEPGMDSHAWNMVYPMDGSEPVLVDVTWDDSDLVNDAGEAICRYDFFYLPLQEDFQHSVHWTTEQFLTSLHE